MTDNQKVRIGKIIEEIRLKEGLTKIAMARLMGYNGSGASSSYNNVAEGVVGVSTNVIQSLKLSFKNLNINSFFDEDADVWLSDDSVSDKPFESNDHFYQTIKTLINEKEAAERENAAIAAELAEVKKELEKCMKE